MSLRCVLTCYDLYSNMLPPGPRLAMGEDGVTRRGQVSHPLCYGQRSNCSATETCDHIVASVVPAVTLLSQLTMLHCHATGRTVA